MNFMKIICVNCGAKNYTKVDHRSYRRNFWSCEKKARKNSGLYGIRTLDLCDTGAALLPVELTSQLGAGRWIGCVHTVEKEAELLIELIPLRFRLSPCVRAALY